MTVLIVDDDPDYLVILRRVIMRRAPWASVLTADGAAPALPLIRAEHPGLVLCDVRMPPPGSVNDVAVAGREVGATVIAISSAARIGPPGIALLSKDDLPARLDGLLAAAPNDHATGAR